MGRTRKQENEAQARKEQEAQTPVEGSEQADASEGSAEGNAEGSSEANVEANAEANAGEQETSEGEGQAQETQAVSEQLIYVKLNPNLDPTVTAVRVAGHSYEGHGDNREVREPVPVSQYEETTKDVYRVYGYQPLVKSRNA